VQLKLDAKAVARELAADRPEEFYWDTELEGFALRFACQPSGVT
jgi:hypothetical protein